MKMLFYPGQYATVSAPFSIPMGGQLTVMGLGLFDSDTITFEVLYVPTARGEACECPPLNAELPQASSTAPLTCCDGTPITLTEDKPFVILDAPQGFILRAKIDATDPTGVISWLTETKTANVTDAMRGCCGQGGA